MRAIDTNIIVRYLTGDDSGQSARAKTVVEAGNIFVGTAVLLETEWVLRSVYGLLPREVAAALRSFSGLPGVSVENPALLAWALDRAERGMDFADSLHLGTAAHCELMFTFDRRFIKAAEDAPVSVIEP